MKAFVETSIIVLLLISMGLQTYIIINRNRLNKLAQDLKDQEGMMIKEFINEIKRNKK